MSVSQTNPAINEAWGVIKYLSGDEQARAKAEAREKARMDLDSWLGDARHEGRQEGLQEGRQEEKLVIARNLLRQNMPHEAVAEATGLSLDAIQRLATGSS